MKASRGPARSSSDTPSYATKTTRRGRSALALRDGSISGIYVIAAQTCQWLLSNYRRQYGESSCPRSRRISRFRVLLAQNRNRETGVETETVSISKTPVEIYSF